MLENIENLKVINIYETACTQYSEFKNRASHALVLKKSGESVYTYENRKLFLKAGQIIFISKGDTYSVKKLSEGESIAIVINFDADIEGSKAMLFDISGFSDAQNDFNEIYRAWLLGNFSASNKCLSLFYKILHELCSESAVNYKNSVQKELIKDSIDYMEKNIFSMDLNVSEIVNRSKISGTYFRNIFIGIYGTTPKKYINNKRLIHARQLIDGGEFGSIREVAEAVGFDDALYFGKIFKQKYGCSPHDYAKSL